MVTRLSAPGTQRYQPRRALLHQRRLHAVLGRVLFEVQFGLHASHERLDRGFKKRYRTEYGANCVGLIKGVRFGPAIWRVLTLNRGRLSRKYSRGRDVSIGQAGSFMYLKRVADYNRIHGTPKEMTLVLAVGPTASAHPRPLTGSAAAVGCSAGLVNR